jgi:hypothetical protein
VVCSLSSKSSRTISCNAIRTRFSPSPRPSRRRPASTAEHRLQRELFVREVAELHGYPSDSHLRQLLPRFPAEVQPLLDALMDEVNHLIHRVRRGARQNQQLLARAVEMHQEMLRTIRPAAFVKTYSPRGQISVSTNDAAWQAAG